VGWIVILIKDILFSKVESSNMSMKFKLACTKCGQEYAITTLPMDRPPANYVCWKCVNFGHTEDEQRDIEDASNLSSKYKMLQFMGKFHWNLPNTNRNSTKSGGCGID
jgi:late competence protein required for DNA uptake (superfamily II DNA/RNA helicase)